MAYVWRPRCRSTGMAFFLGISRFTDDFLLKYANNLRTFMARACYFLVEGPFSFIYRFRCSRAEVAIGTSDDDRWTNSFCSDSGSKPDGDLTPNPIPYGRLHVNIHTISVVVMCIHSKRRLHAALYTAFNGSWTFVLSMTLFNAPTFSVVES